MRSEKQNYSDKYKEIHNLLAEIYLKYKEELELKTVDTFHTKNLNEIAALFKLKSVIFEDTENNNESVSIEDTENNNESVSIEDTENNNESVSIEGAENDNESVPVEDAENDNESVSVEDAEKRE